jgi:hypothetical protein
VKGLRPPRWSMVKGKIDTPWVGRARVWATQNFLNALSSWTCGVEVELALGKPEGAVKEVCSCWDGNLGACGMVMSMVRHGFGCCMFGARM